MKVLVTGGRTYSDWSTFLGTMDRIHAAQPITCIISGACCDREGNSRGADGMAERWARLRGIPYRGYPARWPEHADGWCRCTESEKARGYCKAAGNRRNQWQLDIEHRPHLRYWIGLAVAFVGGSGTRDQVERCRTVGIEVMEVGR